MKNPSAFVRTVMTKHANDVIKMVQEIKSGNIKHLMSDGWFNFVDNTLIIRYEQSTGKWFAKLPSPIWVTEEWVIASIGYLKVNDEIIAGLDAVKKGQEAFQKYNPDLN